MRERGIHFNSEMVRAVMEGRKVQTRRIMKVQPSKSFNPMNMALETDFTAHWYTPGVVDKHGYLQPGKKQVFGVASEDEGYTCPFGAVGDRLWVRETARCEFSREDFTNQVFRTNVAYRADGKSKTFETNKPSKWFPDRTNLTAAGELPWCPSIHMPRWASRITLEITGVRVERLNSISEADALAEGIRRRDSTPVTDPAYCNYLAANVNDHQGWFERPSDSFISLWESIYGGESWQHSPWVWVIEFKRVEGE